MSKRIDGYAFGRIRVGGKPYSADLILYPDRIEENWRRKQGHYLQVEDLSWLVGDPCDALIVGTGGPWGDASGRRSGTLARGTRHPMGSPQHGNGLRPIQCFAG